jgi:hypothetical protein
LELNKLTHLPNFRDHRGNLVFIEGQRHVPFDIKRVFYLFDVPMEGERGSHALKKCHQFIIPISGSFDVLVDNGRVKQRIHLNRPDTGFYLPPMLWREMDNFSVGAICLVLASERYSESDYYRSYQDYLSAINSDSP